MDRSSKKAGENATADPRVVSVSRLVDIIDRLRAPDGCPWDRKQTLATMAPHLVEEAYEALEAVERGSHDEASEELGDLLMVVTLMCRIAEQAGEFDLARAAELVSDKLVRRHPHVFGETKVGSADEVVQNWESIKQGERTAQEKDASALAGVPVALPALQRAQRVCGKAVSAGFRWSTARGALAKLDEEQRELHEALSDFDFDGDRNSAPAREQRTRVEAELGDVLLAAAFLATYLELDPEKLCRQAVRRFEGRFRSMEAGLQRPMREHSLDELMRAWARAKERVE